MDHIGIIKKAWGITWRHRALWALGFLWALVGGNRGGSFHFNQFTGGSPGRSGDFHVGPIDVGMMLAHIQAFVLAHLGIIALLSCFLLIFGIITAIVRYVVQAGVYRVLYHLEVDGIAPTVGAAFREGWHRRTWKLFLQDLALFTMLLILLVVLLAIMAAPASLAFLGHDAVRTIGVIGLVLTGIVVLVIFWAFVVAFGVLSQLWWRAAVIDDMGVIDAMALALHMARARFKDVAIIWILMVGASILFGLFVFVFMLFVIGVVAVVAGAPGYLLYHFTQSLTVALLWGVPVGTVLFILPMTFVTGLYLIFTASVWNNVYLELSRPKLTSTL